MYITPFHILTTSRCAILLKQKALRPIQINTNSVSHNRASSSIMLSEDPHFNISEIYLYPSHKKSKTSSIDNRENISTNEQVKDSKDVALLQITYLKNEKAHLKNVKAVQIQTMPNRRRLKQIINRDGKIITLHNHPNKSNDQIEALECKTNFNEFSGDLNFRCNNQSSQLNVSDQSNSRFMFNRDINILEGFPLIVLFPRTRHRQNAAVVGCKTSKVSS